MAEPQQVAQDEMVDQETEQTVNLKEVADKVGSLDVKIAEAQEKLSKQAAAKRLVELMKERDQYMGQITGCATALDDSHFDEEIVIEGAEYTVTLKKPSNSTEVTKEGKIEIAKYIATNYSKNELMDLIKLGITDLKKYLPKNVFEKNTVTERKGKRGVKVESTL